MRSRFIKDKYERHKFANTACSLEAFYGFVQNPSGCGREENFQALLQLYCQNLNFMAPIDTDVIKSI